MTSRRSAFPLAALLGAALASAAAAKDPGDRRTAEIDLGERTAFCKLLGTVVAGETERAVPGALVALDGRRIRTGEEGLFEFDPVLVGRYALDVRARGYEPRTVVVYAVPPLATVKVRLAPKLETAPFVPAPAGPPPDRAPLRTLVLAPPAPDPPAARGERERKPAAAQGRPGRGEDRGSPGAALAAGRRPFARGTAEVSAGEVWPAGVGAGAIAGRVTDRATGMPLAGALVEVGSRVVRADAAGRYRIAGAPAVRHTVVFSRKGYRAVSRRVLIPAEGEARADAALEPEAAEAPPR